MRSLTSLWIAAALTTACAVGPDYRRPVIDAPARHRGQASPASQEQPANAAAESASLADRAWWEIFQDDALKGLIDESLLSGYDIRLAAWRVEEARANAGIARAEYFPEIAAAAGWSRSRQGPFTSPVPGTFDLYDVNVGLAWEIDFWGRIRRLNEAAFARYLATEEGRSGVLLSLVSEVATGYFRLRALDYELEIAQRTAASFAETHDLFRRRFDAGTASGLETSSAAASLATTQAVIPELEQRIVAQENQLAFLLGRNPGELPRGTALNEQLLPPAIPAGIPSDLLERRPDLREAEQDLVAANAEVGVAVADFFPTIRLTGAFGGVATELSELFDEGKTWSFGAGLLTPVFQGRRLKNQHRAALARWEQAKVRYEQSVTQAFAEVSTALVAYQKLADVEREQTQAVAAYREAVELANSRYLTGLSDYLEVLLAQRQLFPAETALARTRFDRLAVLVQLYRALGGGWQLSQPDWTHAGVERNSAPDVTASR